jgi:hypothetical protein
MNIAFLLSEFIMGLSFSPFCQITFATAVDLKTSLPIHVIVLGNLIVPFAMLLTKLPPNAATEGERKPGIS